MESVEWYMWRLEGKRCCNTTPLLRLESGEEKKENRIKGRGEMGMMCAGAHTNTGYKEKRSENRGIFTTIQIMKFLWVCGGSGKGEASELEASWRL